MNEPKSELSWAQRISMEVFGETGKALRPDDPLILVAAVFRRALDEFVKENEARSAGQGSIQALAFSRRAESELESVLQRLIGSVRTELQSLAGIVRSEDVSALASSSGVDPWRHRIEGVCVGALLVGVGVLLRSLLH